MKKLERNLAVKPLCLDNMSHTTQTWSNLSSSKKRKIWKELEKFQNGLCAYCESKAERGSNTGHIEHFFDKSTHVHLTFDWDNLFGCCDSKFHCGHYKDQKLPGGDRRTYDINLLIKPDLEDPENYLQFLPSGRVEKKAGVGNGIEKKAIETIKALKLDASSLVHTREQQIAIFQSRVAATLDIMDTECDEETLDLAMKEYLKIEEEAETALHRTAIKQAVIWMTS
ncbi:retron Ec78 anti-phage system effector HNH endonuclease PtuB [Vibrio breoganii]